MRSISILAFALGCLVGGCGGGQTRMPEKMTPDEAGSKGAFLEKNMREKLKQFAPVEIGVGEAVPARHRPVLKRLVEAAKQIDRLFWRQVARENPAWREAIGQDPTLKNTLAYFDIMYGPWDRLDQDRPFWGTKRKPPGVTFYPEDLTRDEFEAWLTAHPDQKEELTAYFTVITRSEEGLRAVPYSEVYRDFLEPAAALLEEAAGLAEDDRLATYLRSRARAFGDNQYRQSDFDWMDLGDGDIEVVIGPYEVYEDELMGYKAAFEAFVALRDADESRKLSRIKALLPEMEQFLPIPARHKNTQRGGDSPISVVSLLFSAGDTRAGVQTMAFNLPNDEVVREKKGSKKVMLKNVSHAKYDAILVPIARSMMRDDQAEQVSFDAFFNHTLMHETAHGLGPGRITVQRDGKSVETSVNHELKTYYSVIEEAKADVLGMYLNYFLIDKGFFDEGFIEQIYASYLGGFFRSVRFGVDAAHGMANLIQLNYLMEKRAVVFEKGRYGYDAAKMSEALRALARELLMIEALGDYPAAKRFIHRYGQMPGALEAGLKALDRIPTDIQPIYTIETQMKTW